MTTDKKLDDYNFPLNLDTRKVITLILEVKMSNINGDPDVNGAPPREDPRGFGIFSNVAMKRKIRDYILNLVKQPLFVTPGVDLTEAQEGETLKSMLEKFPDLRYFGGLLPQVKNSKGVKGARVRGPFIVEDGRTPVELEVIPMGITRVSPNKGESGERENQGTMGTKYVTPYALYRINIRFDVFGAQQVGMSESDMALYWESLIECWEHTRSSTRPGVNLRRLYCYDYSNARGNVPTHVVQDWVEIQVEDQGSSWDEYTITADASRMPEGMTLHSWEDGITNVVYGDGGSRQKIAAK